ncbi:hypothetical protein LZZ85_26750 [Terrimonas sp. NA20]|uniref:Uncharacterized protein n=1 Tax=Terrimonas ginsenosidimutans TaxID=2908004 RepID=A0ABS9L027_9BACT|nr:hypothetical protein [Terrimonas ginsenosidimutans]MCG2617930.1 hypothetical protein [Terrimonas ginsenosidimutans]
MMNLYRKDNHNSSEKPCKYEVLALPGIQDAKMGNNFRMQYQQLVAAHPPAQAFNN